MMVYDLLYLIYLDSILHNEKMRRLFGQIVAMVRDDERSGESKGMGTTPRNHSVQKAFQLLKSFRGPDEWVSNAELSRRAELSEACAHRLMKTLEEIGAVVRNTRGAYRPGMVLASLSKNVAIGDLVQATSRDVLVDLAARMSGIVHVGVLENGMVTYAAKVGGPICIPIPSKVGAQQEAYCCALGKVLVAGLDDAQLEEFLHDGKFIALTPQTITGVREMRLEIEAVRQCGYAVDDREVFQTICCIAAPIRDPSGETIAAISLTDSSDHMGGGWRDRVSEALISTAEMVSRKIYPSYGIRPN